jgi:hypothetical protein
LTEIRISDTARGVGRPKEFTERILQPFREGTSARIAAILEAGEERTAFIREAVEKELKRRERSKATAPRTTDPKR